MFGLSEHLKRLSAHGDPLEELGQIIDFEAFRPVLAAALAYGAGAGVTGGYQLGKPFTVIIFFPSVLFSTLYVPYVSIIRV